MFVLFLLVADGVYVALVFVVLLSAIGGWLFVSFQFVSLCFLHVGFVLF